MPRGTLADCIRAVRYETGQTDDLAQNEVNRDQIIHLVNRVQSQLASHFDWHRFWTRAVQPFAAGAGLVSIPTPLTFETIQRVTVEYSDVAVELFLGIEAQDLASYALDDIEERSFPPRRYELSPDGTALQVWPVPDRDGEMMFEGYAELPIVRGDADPLMFDYHMVALYVAAEILMLQQDPAAEARLTAANELRRALHARQGQQKRKPFYMGRTVSAPARPLRRGIDFMD